MEYNLLEGSGRPLKKTKESKWKIHDDYFTKNIEHLELPSNMTQGIPPREIHAIKFQAHWHLLFFVKDRVKKRKSRQNIVQLIKHKIIDALVKESFTKKSCFSFGFFPNEGRRGGALPNFCHLFISAFLVNKRSLFPPKFQ